MAHITSLENKHALWEQNHMNTGFLTLQDKISKRPVCEEYVIWKIRYYKKEHRNKAAFLLTSVNGSYFSANLFVTLEDIILCQFQISMKEYAIVQSNYLIDTIIWSFTTWLLQTATLRLNTMLEYQVF